MIGFVKRIRKIMVSGLVVFILINLFCLVYYNLPARVNNASGATDYKWSSKSLFCRATEGFGYGRINDDGFNNIRDLKDVEKIDVLMMGSSHLEGFNVPQNCIISEVMNKQTDRFYSYNIGISGHNLVTCFDNLENALSFYNPEKYVVFETMTVSLYDGQINDYLYGTRVRDAAFENGIIALAQRLPALRLLASQLNNLRNNSLVDIVSLDPVSNRDLVDSALSRVAKTCRDHGVVAIIFYHPTITAYSDDVVENTIQQDKTIFSELCEKNGIVFLDMAPVFIENYKNSLELPHGFSNSVIGSGHLNTVGHKLVADELIKILNSLEGWNESK